jgi:hypothetical protein
MRCAVEEVANRILIIPLRNTGLPVTTDRQALFVEGESMPNADADHAVRQRCHLAPKTPLYPPAIKIAVLFSAEIGSARDGTPH